MGDYEPEQYLINRETLDQFLASVGPNGVNGQWQLLVKGTDPSTTFTPGVMLDWSLSFGRGLQADNDVPIPSGGVQVLPITVAAGVPTATTPVPASPVRIGPGVVMAIDNTLGPYSPNEGRIYAAFVGYIPFNNNPKTNTDIFVTSSDDGGRTWSPPVQVNDDSSDSDGYSQSNAINPNDTFTGRTQFQPAIAVDPITGTVVVSWRDARNDPSNTVVATYIATSIDGGQTWSAQSYANSPETAKDAITGATDIIGPFADNATATAINGFADNASDTTFGYGSSMGLAVYDGQLYPVWAGDENKGGVGLAVVYHPMVIAAGPRIVNSTQGPITYAEVTSGPVSFNVYFDRPINPPARRPRRSRPPTSRSSTTTPPTATRRSRWPSPASRRSSPAASGLTAAASSATPSSPSPSTRNTSPAAGPAASATTPALIATWSPPTTARAIRSSRQSTRLPRPCRRSPSSVRSPRRTYPCRSPPRAGAAPGPRTTSRPPP